MPRMDEDPLSIVNRKRGDGEGQRSRPGYFGYTYVLTQARLAIPTSINGSQKHSFTVYLPSWLCREAKVVQGAKLLFPPGA